MSVMQEGNERFDLFEADRVISEREIKAIFKFEQVNFNYLQDEAKSLWREISGNNGQISVEYMNEKIRHMVKFWNSVVSNAETRMKNPELYKKYLKIYDSMDVPDRGHLTVEEVQDGTDEV